MINYQTQTNNCLFTQSAGSTYQKSIIWFRSGVETLVFGLSCAQRVALPYRLKIKVLLTYFLYLWWHVYDCSLLLMLTAYQFKVKEESLLIIVFTRTRTLNTCQRRYYYLLGLDKMLKLHVLEPVTWCATEDWEWSICLLTAVTLWTNKLNNRVALLC